MSKTALRVRAKSADREGVSHHRPFYLLRLTPRGVGLKEALVIRSQARSAPLAAKGGPGWPDLLWQSYAAWPPTVA